MKKTLLTLGLSACFLFTSVHGANAEVMIPDNVTKEFKEHNDLLSKYSDKYTYTVNKVIYDSKKTEKVNKEVNRAKVYVFTNNSYDSNGNVVYSYDIEILKAHWNKYSNESQPTEGNTYYIVDKLKTFKLVDIINPNPVNDDDKDKEEKPKKKFKFKPKPKA